MSEIFEFTTANMQAIQGLKAASHSRAKAPVADPSDPDKDPNRLANATLIGDLQRRIGEFDRFFERSKLNFEPVNRARGGVDAINDLVSAAKALAQTALSLGSLSQAATATGSISLSADAPVSLGGSRAFAEDAVVSVTGATAKSADAAAVATGTTNVGSSTNLISDTSLSSFETLTVTVDGSQSTITFGLLPGQTNTAADLESRLDAIAGISAGYDGDGQLVITSDDALTGFTIGGTADIQAAFGIAEQAYSPTNLLTQGVAQGETLTFQVGGGSLQTITFGTGGGEVGTLAELDAALAGLTGVTASIDGSSQVTFAADSIFDSVTVAGSADVATAFGITEQTYDPTNLLTQGLAQDETLTVQVGGGAVQTITFGTGGGEVGTLAELDTALAGLTGVTASVDGSNQVALTATSALDTVTIGGSADIGTALGIAEQTYTPTNLLTQGLAQGETLTFQVSSGAVQTITFGSGGGEVGTIADLNTALAGITGLTATVDGSSQLTFTASSVSDTVTVGGTADIAAAFGLAEAQYDPTAGSGTPTDEFGNTRASLQAEYNDLIAKIADEVTAARSRDVNLLEGLGRVVQLSDKVGDSYRLQSHRVGADDLGLAAIEDFGFEVDANIDAAIAGLDDAAAKLGRVSRSLDRDHAVLTSRSDLYKGLSEDFAERLEKLQAVEDARRQAQEDAAAARSRLAGLFSGQQGQSAVSLLSGGQSTQSLLQSAGFF